MVNVCPDCGGLLDPDDKPCGQKSEWARFRTAYEIELARRGLRNTHMGLTRLTESHGSPDTVRENVRTDAKTDMVIGTMSSNRKSESSPLPIRESVPFKSIPVSGQGRTSSLNVSGAANGFAARNGDCRLCDETDPLDKTPHPHTKPSERATRIFGASGD